MLKRYNDLLQQAAALDKHKESLEQEISSEYTNIGVTLMEKVVDEELIFVGAKLTIIPQFYNHLSRGMPDEVIALWKQQSAAEITEIMFSGGSSGMVMVRVIPTDKGDSDYLYSISSLLISYTLALFMRHVYLESATE